MAITIGHPVSLDCVNCPSASDKVRKQQEAEKPKSQQEGEAGEWGSMGGPEVTFYTEGAP